MREQNDMNRAGGNDGGRVARLRLEDGADRGANQRDVTGSREQLLITCTSRPLRNLAVPRHPPLGLRLYGTTLVATVLYSDMWSRVHRSIRNMGMCYYCHSGVSWVRLYRTQSELSNDSRWLTLRLHNRYRRQFANLVMQADYHVVTSQWAQVGTKEN